MNEAAFIAALRTLATHPAARGLNDDCAVLDVGAAQVQAGQQAVLVA